uniref:RNase H type-1 domain-containing protein n=1 Tax=Nicotiana tabacum TaxID=4097 RepID=A0A1S4DCK5_TOBAC|nr:PREDICTED: uncharacterized protein LOC107828360 [Nicotiana tabacum]
MCRRPKKTESVSVFAATTRESGPGRMSTCISSSVRSCGLKLALKYSNQRLVLYCDSQLMVNQVTGLSKSKNRVYRKLEDAKGLWPELLPEVLWAYRTTPKTSTGEMPYSLVYGTDAVIPVEVREPSLRYSNESGPSNDKSRLQDLDEVEDGETWPT